MENNIEEKKEENNESPIINDGGVKIPKIINFNPLTGGEFPEKKEEEKKEEAPVEEKKEEPVKEEVKAEDKPQVDLEKKEEPVKADESEKKESLFEIASPVDAIKKLDEYSMEKYGISFQDAMNFKNTKHEELEELDIVETAYRLEDPDITPVEINAKNLKFAPLFLSEDEQEKLVEDGKITHEQLTILDAEFEGVKRKALQTINKAKAGISFDEIKFSQKNEQPEPVKVTDEQVTAMKEAVTQVLNNLKQDKFVMKDKDGKELATVNVDIADAKKVVEIASDPNSIYKLWVDEKGNFDVAKYTRDIARLLNIDKYVDVIYSNGVNKGREIEGKGDIDLLKDKKGEAVHKETPKITPHQVVLGNIT